MVYRYLYYTNRISTKQNSNARGKDINVGPIDNNDDPNHDN